MTCQDVIRAALPGRSPEVLVESADAAWMRAGDLIVGATTVSASDFQERLASAYSLVDNDAVVNPLRGDELWNLVLLVCVPAGRDDMARQIAQDLRYSRKVTYRDGDVVPRLVGPFLAERSDSILRVDDPIGAAIDAVATASERTLLTKVLLGKDRRDRSESEELLDLLERGDEHG